MQLPENSNKSSKNYIHPLLTHQYRRLLTSAKVLYTYNRVLDVNIES